MIYPHLTPFRRGLRIVRNIVLGTFLIFDFLFGSMRELIFIMGLIALACYWDYKETKR